MPTPVAAVQPAVRRTNEAVAAAAFAAAVAALEPFFDPGLCWSGAHLEHFAYRALRERYPELTTSQAYVIVIAARRLYGDRTG